MKNRRIIYWLSQGAGWGLFVAGNWVADYLTGATRPNLLVISCSVFVLGIAVTHAFRALVHRLKWGSKGVLSLIPRVLLSSLVLSLLFVTLNTMVNDLLLGRIPFYHHFILSDFLKVVLNTSVLFLLWNLIYFAVKTFENYRREQIKNLELRAAKTEIELNSLKAQMNPHFIFNSMNSIRALVDEDPESAKNAITLLSGILRNNLLLGKKQLVLLREELDLVDKYLSLEKIRFEERLHVRYSIDPAALHAVVPPFMLQTIVENAIKHGISRRKEGGEIGLTVRREDQILSIEVRNTGKLMTSAESTGIGLANTRNRLELLYGSTARFTIAEIGDDVVVSLEIPLHIQTPS